MFDLMYSIWFWFRPTLSGIKDVLFVPYLTFLFYDLIKKNDVEASDYRAVSGYIFDVLVLNLPFTGNFTFLTLKKFLFERTFLFYYSTFRRESDRTIDRSLLMDSKREENL